MAYDPIVTVRFPEEERQRLIEEAKYAGLTTSELIRRRCLGKKVLANADEIMIRELRRIGGLVKHIHNESGGVYSKETSDVLITIKKYLDKLSQ